MNNNLNLVEILKDCPKGTQFYSPVYGKIEFIGIDAIESKFNVDKIAIKWFKDENTSFLEYLRADGTFRGLGECIIFPSKEQRDWSKWQNPFVDGDILATDEKKTYHNTRFGFERLLDFEKELPKINKILNMCGYEWDTEKKELKTLQPFKDGDILLNKPDSECMLLLSKNQYDWSIWLKPFVDGDVVIFGDERFAIFKEYIQFGEIANLIRYYLHYDAKNDDLNIDEGECWMQRIATEEEKEKFFDAIKSHGYKWNAETKTLEKLIVPKFKSGDMIVKKDDPTISWSVQGIDTYYQDHYCIITKGMFTNLYFKDQDDWELLETTPKFKVGDKIRHKTDRDYIFEISRVYNDSYGLVGSSWMIPMNYQNEYELVSNKFDISTLKPFDWVLVRDDNTSVWINAFFGFYDTEITKKHPFVANGVNWAQCIPYEGNENLLGKYDDCDEYYKNWV